MEWLKHFSRAVDYIEDNLTGEISLVKAAEIACCSSFYFQRMFTYVTGLTPAEYIRRRKMSSAALDLQSGKGKIMETGMKYGYDSPSSFNRAFRSVHGISPLTARSMGTKLNYYPRIRLSVTVNGGSGISYRIENKPAFRITGIRTRLKENMEENFRIVPGFWDNILRKAEFREICRLADKYNSGILGVTLYKSPEEIFRY